MLRQISAIFQHVAVDEDGDVFADIGLVVKNVMRQIGRGQEGRP